MSPDRPVPNERTLRFAVMGTGFWSHYQIPAWLEIGNVELVAVYNRTRSKAEQVAEKFNIPRVYGDPEALLENEDLDFLDVITEVPAHAPLVLLAARHRVPVICQKPMAPDYETAQKMVTACSEAEIPFFVHENFRWQTPIREIKDLLVKNAIGRVFRARIQFVHYLEPFVWNNQPLLKTLDHLIIADQGSHQFDLVRFLMGEMESVYCQSLRVRPDIKAEDVASATFRSVDGTICNVELSFVSRTEWDHFPEVLVYLEGTEGTLELGPDYWIRLTTQGGTRSYRCPPPRYDWADPAYDVCHASMVAIHHDFAHALRTGASPETTGEDNLKTVRLVQAAYASAAKCQVVYISQEGSGDVA